MSERSAFCALDLGPYSREVQFVLLKGVRVAPAPAYQHPRFVCFLEELPLSTTNKIDRAELMRVAEERRPSGC